MADTIESVDGLVIGVCGVCKENTADAIFELHMTEKGRPFRIVVVTCDACKETMLTRPKLIKKLREMMPHQSFELAEDMN